MPYTRLYHPWHQSRSNLKTQEYLYVSQGIHSAKLAEAGIGIASRPDRDLCHRNLSKHRQRLMGDSLQAASTETVYGAAGASGSHTQPCRRAAAGFTQDQLCQRIE